MVEAIRDLVNPPYFFIPNGTTTYKLSVLVFFLN